MPPLAGVHLGGIRGVDSKQRQSWQQHLTSSVRHVAGVARMDFRRYHIDLKSPAYVHHHWGESPVTRKLTWRAIATAWSAKRS
jgi:hypothetical protein